LDDDRSEFLNIFFQRGHQENYKQDEPKSLPTDRIEAAKYETLKKKLIITDNTPKDSKFKPKLFGYRFLAPLPEVPPSIFPKQQRLQLWVPNTLVYDRESPPFWIYSKDGFVYRTDDFTDSQAINRLGSVNKYELVAVCRTVSGVISVSKGMT